MGQFDNNSRPRAQAHCRNLLKTVVCVVNKIWARHCCGLLSCALIAVISVVAYLVLKLKGFAPKIEFHPAIAEDQSRASSATALTELCACRIGRCNWLEAGINGQINNYEQSWLTSKQKAIPCALRCKPSRVYWLDLQASASGIVKPQAVTSPLAHLSPWLLTPTIGKSLISTGTTAAKPRNCPFFLQSTWHTLHLLSSPTCSALHLER